MESAHERRQDHTPDQEFAGLAARSLREGVPVDELELRLENRDGSVGSDAKRVDELRGGAKAKLLKMAGYTTEKAAVELQPTVVEEKDAVFAASEGRFTAEEQASLFSALESRFAANSGRYEKEGIKWADVKKALEAADKSLLYGLIKMEDNGHEVGVMMEEKDGRKGFRFDSCSKSSPKGKRNVDYEQADAFAKKWNAELMGPVIFDQLLKAGIITESGTWSHLKTDAATPDDGRSWCGDDVGSIKISAYNHSQDGGFRCSLWVPEV